MKQNLQTLLNEVKKKIILHTNGVSNVCTKRAQYKKKNLEQRLKIINNTRIIKKHYTQQPLLESRILSVLAFATGEIGGIIL